MIKQNYDTLENYILQLKEDIDYFQNKDFYKQEYEWATSDLQIIQKFINHLLTEQDYEKANELINELLDGDYINVVNTLKEMTNFEFESYEEYFNRVENTSEKPKIKYKNNSSN